MKHVYNKIKFPNPYGFYRPNTYYLSAEECDALLRYIDNAEMIRKQIKTYAVCIKKKTKGN